MTETFLMRIPADLHGERFVEDLKRYLNKDTYNIKVRYTGKRKNPSAGHTRKSDATSMRIYITENNPVSDDRVHRLATTNMEFINDMRTITNIATRSLSNINVSNTS